MDISAMHFAKLGMKPLTRKKVSGKMLDELDADNIAKLQESIQTMYYTGYVQYSLAMAGKR
jgi:hypothetical protein